MRFIKISWQRFEKDCVLLAKKIIQTKIHFDRIVVISRGGLVIGRLFSDLIPLPISHITISSYTDLKQNKDVKITEVPKTVFSRQRLLLVDEISDSGKTFIRARSYFQRFSGCQVTTACLYVKPMTKPLPDFWQKQLDGWVIFPYEVNETYRAFIKTFSNKQQAKRKLFETGVKEWEVMDLR